MWQKDRHLISASKAKLCLLNKTLEILHKYWDYSWCLCSSITNDMWIDYEVTKIGIDLGAYNTMFLFSKIYLEKSNKVKAFV
jgi:hypothetical protein